MRYELNSNNNMHILFQINMQETLMIIQVTHTGRGMWDSFPWLEVRRWFSAGFLQLLRLASHDLASSWQKTGQKSKFQIHMNEENRCRAGLVCLTRMWSLWNMTGCIPFAECCWVFFEPPDGVGTSMTPRVRCELSWVHMWHGSFYTLTIQMLGIVQCYFQCRLFLERSRAPFYYHQLR